MASGGRRNSSCNSRKPGNEPQLNMADEESPEESEKKIDSLSHPEVMALFGEKNWGKTVEDPLLICI